MSENFSFDRWRARLHDSQDFSSEEKCNEFIELLSEAEANMSYEVIVELLKTFSDADDFGVHERTRNIVEATDRGIFYPALVQELDGLIARSPEKQWALTLVGIELDYGDFDLLLSYARKATQSAMNVFISFVKSSEFASEYPSVAPYLKGI